LGGATGCTIYPDLTTLLMRALPLRALLLLALLASAAVSAGAQTPAPVLTPTPAGMVQRLTLRDGSQLVGRILSVDSTSIQFESALGQQTIAVSAIVGVRSERPGTMRNGQYYFANPNSTRLIFAPTGRMLKTGEGYVNDFWVFLPGFAAGLSDRFTFGGGMSVMPGVNPADQIFFVTPKVGVIQRDAVNIAVGALALSVPNFDDGRESAGLLYGVGTWGSPDASFTTGLAYGYVGGTLANSPAIMLGGEARASPRISFVSENYVFPGGSGLLSGAIRFMGQDIAVDLGLAHVADGQDQVTFPVLNFMWKW